MVRVTIRAEDVGLRSIGDLSPGLGGQRLSTSEEMEKIPSSDEVGVGAGDSVSTCFAFRLWLCGEKRYHFSGASIRVNACRLMGMAGRCSRTS
ncbi:hypothetical protein NPIL_622971 [Nephila pilipes]|uniref:Uncharacterized protein n=1 Tax=Nephila pilipes TaxID=299642 RepID=A0A8X6MX85_NEPPI|nr:hypothetical protein NPIL_622971 [Nephila pilipes]